jgi:sialic acid synthase SpsE
MEFDKVFIIAEAGSNWRLGAPGRDMRMAKALVDVASEAGADAVKFQTYTPEKVYVQHAGIADYLSSGTNESINEIFADLSMPYEMIPELAGYCKKLNIQFMSTPFSVSDAKVINPFVNIHKIASYEISHLRLIEFMAKTGKPVILSTGAANYDDIEWAINYFHEKGGHEISLMQATAKYPATYSMLNLKAIPSLKESFKVQVGLSDHSRDPIVGPVSAVSLGASIIEKHFTLHNKLPGPDHSFALTPKELKYMVNAVRNCEKSLGTGIKTVQKEEEELRRFAQRSIQASEKILKGDIMEEGINIEILRPGKRSQGLHPKYISEIQGKKATRDIGKGEGIATGDYQTSYLSPQ